MKENNKQANARRSRTFFIGKKVIYKDKEYEIEEIESKDLGLYLKLKDGEWVNSLRVK